MSDMNIVELEFDPVGTNPKNWVSHEQHTIGPKVEDKWRFIKPKYGPVFTHDLKLEHRKPDGTWEELVPATHYTFGFRLVVGSRDLLQPVYTVLQILDNSLVGEFRISYHSVGSSVSVAVQALKIEGAKALLEPKKYTLEDIIDAPYTFPPVDHDVLTDDVYGWNKVVEAITTLSYAIAGDPQIPHEHEMEDVVNLVDTLKGKATLNNSHKTSIHNAQRITNHTGTVSLTLPTFKNTGKVSGNIVMFVGDGQVTFARFYGEVAGENDITDTDADWHHGQVELFNGKPFSKVAFTYDTMKRPVIYLGDNVNYEDVTFVLTDVTFSSDYTLHMRNGYSFTKEPGLRGTAKDVIRVGAETQQITWASHQTAIHYAKNVSKDEKSFTLVLPEINHSAWVTASLQLMNDHSAELLISGYVNTESGDWENVHAVSNRHIYNDCVKGYFTDGLFIVDIDNSNNTFETTVVIKSVTFGTDVVPNNRFGYAITTTGREVPGDCTQIRQPGVRDYETIGNEMKDITPEPGTTVLACVENTKVTLSHLPHHLPEHGDRITVRNLCPRALLYPTNITGDVVEDYVLDVTGGEVEYFYDVAIKKYKLIGGR